MDQNDELQIKYDDQLEQLRNQISVVELRQQELQNYITSLDQTIQQIDRIIFQEEQKQQKDYSKIKNLRMVSSKNLEMIIEIYNTYQNFENVKFKYYKEIDSHSHAGIRLINIELVKLQNQTTDLSDSFMEMIKYLSNLKNNGDKSSDSKTLITNSETAENLEDNPEYQL